MKVYVVMICVVFCGLAKCGNALFIQPCGQEDTKCLISSAQSAVPLIARGVPSMGIAVLDPMHVKRVKTSQAGLDMDFRNTSVTGLKHCKVLNLKRRVHQTFLDLKCSVTLVGDYSLGGKLLIMPIEGNGRYAIKIRDIIVKILFNIGEKTRAGDEYWVVNSWQHKSHVEKNVHFQFMNLFNGNKQLSDVVLQFANQNWRDIFHEVAPPIVTAIITKIVDESTKLFDKVPIKDLALI